MKKALQERIAKKLEAEVFATQDALDKYLQEHPDADRSLHRVKKDRQFEDVFSPSHSMSKSPFGIPHRMTFASELVKLAKELVAEVSLFDETNADEMAEKVKSELGKVAPVVHVRKSSLGGPAHLTLMLTISIDPKEKWSNGILENSRYCRMSISRGGEIEHFSGHGMDKFRKSRVADIDSAIRKISDFIKKAQAA